MTYDEFLETKKFIMKSSGFECGELNSMLFDFQKDISRWSVKKGRACIFADCGLGKTPMQLVWADKVCSHTGEDVLIAAPLAVSQQTKREGDKFGIKVNICRTSGDLKLGINITNYEMLEHFSPDELSGIVLDESSIIKHHDSKTREMVIDMFRETPYKLACTATPAPNDYMELGNHAEFMGVMTRSEMLSTFFVHDGGDTAKWRLKGHAESKFWEWLSNWAVVMTKPSDLGYIDDGFILPDMTMHEHIVKSVAGDIDGQMLLLPELASTLLDRRQARRGSLGDRCKLAADIISQKPDEQWLVWCDLNDESAELSKIIPGAIEVKGSDSNEHKSNSMLGFSNGDVKVLVTKPSIAGFGMNWQNCHNMIFVGLSDSYEMLYQAIRRCWRFGQKEPVDVHIVISEAEGAVKANVIRKEADAQRMIREMVKHTQNILSTELHNIQHDTIEYKANKQMKIPSWLRSEAA